MIRRLTPDDAAALKEVRLAALLDAPGSFASSHEREVAFPDDEWRARLHPDANPTYVWDDGVVQGMAVGARDDDDPTLTHLYGMWVRPDARGGPAADALVLAVLDWARATGAASIQLHVAFGNERAERLYARHGFARTGVADPHPCGDGWAFEMSRPLP